MSLFHKSSHKYKYLLPVKRFLGEIENINVSVTEENYPQETENVDVSINEATFNAEEIPINFTEDYISNGE